MEHLTAFCTLLLHGDPTALVLTGLLGFCVSAWVTFLFVGFLRLGDFLTRWQEGEPRA